MKYNILEKIPSMFTAMTWNFLHCLNSNYPLLFALIFAVSAASTRSYSLLLSVKKNNAKEIEPFLQHFGTMNYLSQFHSEAAFFNQMMTLHQLIHDHV